MSSFVFTSHGQTTLKSRLSPFCAVPHHRACIFPGSTSTDNYCDGITLLDDTTVAIKFSRSASIFIWSLDRVLRKVKSNPAVINVKPDLILPWVKTTEIYIDITSR